MKILFVSEYFWPKGAGGGEISLELLAKKLVKKGYDVSVLTSHFKGLSKFEIKDGFRIFRMAKTGENPSGFLSNFKRAYIFPKSIKKAILKLHANEKFDVIHCMNLTSVHIIDIKKRLKALNDAVFLAHMNSPLNVCPKGNLLLNGETECKKKFGFLTCFRCCMNSPTIGTRKNSFFSRYNPAVFYAIYRRFKNIHKRLKLFDKLIAISEYPKKRMGKYTAKKIEVLYNIVDVEEFLSLKSKQNEMPKILYIGQYTKIKGTMTLLAALKKLKDDTDLEFECNFYGSGNIKDDLIEYVKFHNLNVKINNKIPFVDVPKKYGEHDLVIFPSEVPEAFGRVAIEAMAASKPVIGSRIGGIRFLIDEGKNGLLFEPGNVEDLKQKLIILLKNKDLREKLGKNGREKTKTTFSGDVIVKKAIEIYERTLCP